MEGGRDQGECKLGTDTESLRAQKQNNYNYNYNEQSGDRYFKRSMFVICGGTGLDWTGCKLLFFFLYVFVVKWNGPLRGECCTLCNINVCVCERERALGVCRKGKERIRIRRVKPVIEGRQIVHAFACNHTWLRIVFAKYDTVKGFISISQPKRSGR